MYLIGIDVGGTNSKFGILENDKLIKSFTWTTNAFDIVRQIANGIKELAQSIGKDLSEIDGVAVGFPGMVIDNIVKDSPNIGLQDCDLATLLKDELGEIPIVVRNDAEMATLAENKIGVGTHCKNFVMLTIGTGVGGGIVINNQLYSGNGGAGELGHLVIARDGLPCKCGRRGCAEQYVSLTALDRICKDLIGAFPDSKIPLNDDSYRACDIVKAYKRNDECAKEVLRRYTQDLSLFIMNICNMFRPEKIVIGGGLIYAPEIIDMVARICKEQNFGFVQSPTVDIVATQLDNDAGIIGAVACFDKSSMNNISEDMWQELEVQDELVYDQDYDAQDYYNETSIEESYQDNNENNEQNNYEEYEQDNKSEENNDIDDIMELFTKSPEENAEENSLNNFKEEYRVEGDIKESLNRINKFFGGSKQNISNSESETNNDSIDIMEDFYESSESSLTDNDSEQQNVGNEEASTEYNNYNQENEQSYLSNNQEEIELSTLRDDNMKGVYYENQEDYEESNYDNQEACKGESEIYETDYDQEGETEYDEGILDRINMMLKNKK